jgi:hypothetical protein
MSNKTTKHKLSIQDSLVLRSLLLEMGGSRADLDLATATIEQVFSEKDMAAYQVGQGPNGITWRTADKDTKKLLPAFKEVEFGPQALKMIRGALAKMDEAKVLQRLHIPLYDLFLVDKGDEPDA